MITKKIFTSICGTSAILLSLSNNNADKSSVVAFTSSSSFVSTISSHNVKLYSAIEGAQTEPVSPSMTLVEQFISHYKQSLQEGNQWAHEFGFVDEDNNDEDDDALSPEGAFYALFRAIRQMDDNNDAVTTSSDVNDNNNKLLGLNGTPFYVPSHVLAEAEESKKQSKNAFSDYFHFPHLAKALTEDFLDAQRGSTNNKLGWQVSAVSQPTGSSFNDARMTVSQVQSALEVGTVIFNNIGAHIPRLAGPTLASTDALSLPGALNMYVTSRGMRTSAPPHTDRQDVLVVQMEGAKRWRVFTPPMDGEVKPYVDPFARGKGEDSLPLHTLLEGKEGRLRSELVMDVVTREGDVLFIPAGFPHTTDTVEETSDVDYDTSIHLTFNIDTHVWDLDYLAVRSAALQRNKVNDALSSFENNNNNNSNRYIGKVNQLPANIRSGLMDALPLKFLDIVPSDNPDFMNNIARQLSMRCDAVNKAMEQEASEQQQLSESSYVEALERIHSYGSAILEVHRDMYLAAVQEGRLRKYEDSLTAHLKPKDDDNTREVVTMTPERMQRLSLFRVRPFFEQIDSLKKDLNEWCLSGGSDTQEVSPSSQLDFNWQFTAPLKVGDEVEADLGGVFFAAKIAQVTGNTYNVVFFDGDRENGLQRDQIKLLKAPTTTSSEDGFDTTGMTPKEIKRMRKKMEKKRK